MSDVEKEVERVAKLMWNARERHYGDPVPYRWNDAASRSRDVFCAMARAVIRDQNRQAKSKRRVKK